MNIYVSHSTSYNYKEELYLPLRNSLLNDIHKINLPHELSDLPTNTKVFLKTQDVVIAEVSYPSTGQGIELGWANMLEIKVLCIYKENTKHSRSLDTVTSNFSSYNPDNLIKVIEDALDLLQGN